MRNGQGPERTSRPSGLMRELTVRDGIAVVAGSVIGSGIFLVPGQIALSLGTLRSVMLVWIGGGLLTLFGALSLAELGGMFPSAGGLYTYLREAYGRPVGFLYGWVLITVIQTGSIATLASGFALYLSQLVSFGVGVQKLLAVLAILTFTALNLMSLHRAKQIQNAGTVAKLLGIVALAALLFARGHSATLWTASPGATAPTLLGFGASLTAVLWAYEGWHVVSFTAGEFRNPTRDLPRSLIAGALIVAATYLVLNLAYYSVLRPAQVAGSASTAASAMLAAWGPGMTRLVSLVIVTSILCAINGMVLTGPRVYFAMARDGLFFPSLGRTTVKSRVPANALVVQGIWASLLTLIGQFQQLFSLVIFSAWIFYGLSVGAVLVLRWRSPERERPFRTPGAPLLPALFVLASAGVVVSSFLNSWRHALLGIVFLLLGLPVYFLFTRANRESADQLTNGDPQ